jgi:hypothetical protein
MFNTGTVVGVSANIFWQWFRNFVPSFSWVEPGFTHTKAFETKNSNDSTATEIMLF